ncbi:MAG: hypothetical protein LBL58_12540 [Tannerellaceae bacterium]|jgi:hypothetical protein|nr:hypothetical protein [Tannerellaceae bacterium]
MSMIVTLVSLRTVIRNKELLQKALEKTAAQNIRVYEKSLKCDLDRFHVELALKGDLTFSINTTVRTSRTAMQRHESKSQSATEALEVFKSDLTTAYGALVQEHVYETLKRKAVQKGLTLEKEAIQNDQSIVLTYTIN